VKHLWLSIALSLTAGCGGRPPEDLPQRLRICTEDADCAAFELDCCSSCAGGTLLSARADTTRNDLAPYRRRCGLREGCLDVGCIQPTPACNEGACGFAEVDGFTWSTFGGGPEPQEPPF
jgi:hypothetical protein